MDNISNRLLNLPTSSVRALVKYQKKAIENNIEIIQLNIGEPDLHVPQCYIQSHCEFKRVKLGYAPSQGMDILINEVLKYYATIGSKYEKSEVHITNGGSEAILFAFLATCDTGDKVIVPEPYYSNYNSIAANAGVKLIAMETKIDNNFHLPKKALITKLIDKDTKAILLSNPSNPTGVIYTLEEITMICEIAIEKKLWIIADEVYREFVFDDKITHSFANQDECIDRIIIVDSISKRFSACGARIGMLLTKNEALNRAFLKLCQSRLSVSIAEQLAAASLYKQIDKNYYLEMANIYCTRRNALVSELSKIPGVISNIPDGAFYLMARLPVDNSFEFCKWLLTEYHFNNTTVMLTPAQGFYSEGDRGINEVRIAFVVDENKIKQASKIIRNALKEYQKRFNK